MITFTNIYSSLSAVKGTFEDTKGVIRTIDTKVVKRKGQKDKQLSTKQCTETND